MSIINNVQQSFFSNIDAQLDDYELTADIIKQAAKRTYQFHMYQRKSLTNNPRALAQLDEALDLLVNTWMPYEIDMIGQDR